VTDVIEYKEGHLDFIVPLDCYGPSAKDNAHLQSLGSVAYTLVADSRPIAVLGCQQYGHILNLWALAGKAIAKYPVFYHKTLKRLIDHHMDDEAIFRVQSLVRADNELAINQHLKLGFVIEAKLEKAGPDMEDQLLMRKFKNG
jgi:hypothetical protein